MAAGLGSKSGCRIGTFAIDTFAFAFCLACLRGRHREEVKQFHLHHIEVSTDSRGLINSGFCLPVKCSDFVDFMKA